MSIINKTLNRLAQEIQDKQDALALQMFMMGLRTHKQQNEYLKERISQLHADIDSLKKIIGD